MARRSYTVVPAGAKVTAEPGEAMVVVAAGAPVVLVSADDGELVSAIVKAPDRSQRQRLLAVMAGAPQDANVQAAAAEMAGELFGWARTQPRAEAPGSAPGPK